MTKNIFVDQLSSVHNTQKLVEIHNFQSCGIKVKIKLYLL